VALDRAQDMPTLSALLENVPTPLRSAQSVTAARPAEHVEDTLFAARQQALKDDVETFYLNVVDRAEQAPISALDYLNQSELQWPPEIWLFQVIAEHQGLPHSEQRAFHLHQQEERASAFNDVRLIRDVSLGLAV